MKEIIRIEKMVKRFTVGEGYFTALKGIDLTVHSGEFTGLIGPSGSGKSTLLNIIGTLDSPSEGNVQVLDVDISDLTSKTSASMRNHHIGFIFQSYNLLPVYRLNEM